MLHSYSLLDYKLQVFYLKYLLVKTLKNNDSQKFVNKLIAEICINSNYLLYLCILK
nr:MAG TPA: hypothetical protein [Caudoviricetes sp.]